MCNGLRHVQKCRLNTKGVTIIRHVFIPATMVTWVHALESTYPSTAPTGQGLNATVENDQDGSRRAAQQARRYDGHRLAIIYNFHVKY